MIHSQEEVQPVSFLGTTCMTGCVYEVRSILGNEYRHNFLCLLGCSGASDVLSNSKIWMAVDID